jgi:hypothetical protein
MDAKTQRQYAETFHGLHKKGDPLVLFTPGTSPPPRPSRRLLRPSRQVVERSRPHLATRTEKMPRSIR